MNKRMTRFFDRMRRIPGLRHFVRPLVFFHRLIFEDFGLKIASLLIAVLLWNYVVTSETTFMRTKTISDISASFNRSSLSRLALPEDPADVLDDIAVMVEVSQSEFAYVTSGSVQVSLDLSRISASGTQSVPLKATTTYGRVIKVIPDSVTLTFEPKDTRILPVSTQFIGEPREDLRYIVRGTNPENLEIRGASSLVNRVSRVMLDVDVTDIELSQRLSLNYKLLDSNGETVDPTMLDLSTSSVAVRLEVWPQREISICNEIDKLVIGEPAEGYTIESIDISPASLIVAGEEDLLNSVTELYLEPVDITDATRSVSQKARVSALSSFSYVSAEDVYISVNIAEETVSEIIEADTPEFINCSPLLLPEYSSTPIRVSVKGPRSAVQALTETGLTPVIDLEGLTAGEHDVKIEFLETIDPEITLVPETKDIRFMLKETQPVPDGVEGNHEEE